MLPLLFIALLVLAIILIVVSSVSRRKRRVASQIAATLQTFTRDPGQPGAVGTLHTLMGTHADGTPMSEQELRAYQSVAHAGFAAMRSGGDSNVVKVTMSGAAIDPALAEQVREQLNRQGFGKLGEIVAEQMQHRNGNNASAFEEGGTTPSSAYADISVKQDPFGSSSTASSPFHAGSQGSNLFSAGTAFGHPSPDASPQTYVAPPPETGMGTASWRGSLGVARFLSESGAVDGSTTWAMEREQIGRAPERVTAPAVPGIALRLGDRVYVDVDPNDEHFVTLAAELPTGYRVLVTGNDNRADPLVLGPALRTDGARATGTVKTAERLSASAAGPPNAGNWRVEMDVAPEHGGPFTAEIVIGFSTPQRAEAITRIGAQVPLLYDPQHPQTIAVDARAMGFADH